MLSIAKIMHRRQVNEIWVTRIDGIMLTGENRSDQTKPCPSQCYLSITSLHAVSKLLFYVLQIFAVLTIVKFCKVCYRKWPYPNTVSNSHLRISRWGHGCLFLLSVVCCLVEVSASDWSLVQESYRGVTRESKHRASPSLLLWRGALSLVNTFDSRLTKVTVN
jgi:hypothetical protein